jgi:putative SOS response-associated peptidase YedK
MGTPLGIAGIYRKWRHPDGRELFTFAMLTVSAEGHPIYSRFHKPGDEKRMVVILDREDYGEWLQCPVEDAPKFFKQWGGPLEFFANPLPPRAPRADSGRVIRPPAPPENAADQGDLF